MRKLYYGIVYWENWHWFIKYILLGPIWLWYCLRARSLWFFMPANPSITFGGYLGESKREIYEQLPTECYPKSVFITRDISTEQLKEIISKNDFEFPIAVKPDVGMMGFMFRRIESLKQLEQYHAAMPVDYIIQDFVNHQLEVSVFYYRFPHEKSGHITGFVKKEFMEVIGDGKTNLATLIRNYPRARLRQKELLLKHESKLQYIVPNGTRYCLSYALNLSRGGKLVSLEHEKDDELVKVFDHLSHHSKNFFYGRYDVKCESVEDLKKGKNFSVLEYNGSGAEPHHIYGNGYSFFKACSILIHHWDILYRISKYNYEIGIPRWKTVEGWVFLKKVMRHFKKMARLDLVFEFESEQSLKRSAVFSDSVKKYTSKILVTDKL
jgi:hypothetical protein